MYGCDLCVTPRVLGWETHLAWSLPSCVSGCGIGVALFLRGISTSCFLVGFRSLGVPRSRLSAHASWHGYSSRWWCPQLSWPKDTLLVGHTPPRAQSPLGFRIIRGLLWCLAGAPCCQPSLSRGLQGMERALWVSQQLWAFLAIPTCHIRITKKCPPWVEFFYFLEGKS